MEKLPNFLLGRSAVHSGLNGMCAEGDKADLAHWAAGIRGQAKKQYANQELPLPARNEKVNQSRG